MFKKIVVAMSTILILVSCLVPFTVSAGTSGVWLDDEGQTYSFDYVNVQQFKDKKIDFPFIIYFDGMSSNTNPKTSFTIYAFKEVPTLFYDETNDIYYFDAYEDDNVAFMSASKKRAYYDHFDVTSVKGKRYIYFKDFSFTKDAAASNLNVSLYKDMLSDELFENVTSDFTPIFDESCSDLDKSLWGQILSDDAFNGYQDNVTIDVKPSINSSPTRSWTIPKEYLKDDVSKLINYDVSDYFFTVTVSNKGGDPFEFYLTANKERYNERGSYYQQMKESSDDLLNTFQVNDNPLIKVEPNSTFTYNFNFSEIDHYNSTPTAFGGMTPLYLHQIFLNFWTQESYRIAFDGLPYWKLPEIDPETGLPVVDESDIDEDGRRIFGRSKAYRCAYSHNMSFYGTWKSKVEKQDNYKDVIDQLPIADIISGNEYSPVEFDLNPDMDDFKSMIDNSKGFLEFVRYGMSNFVPSWFWITIAVGLTGIVILRILGR